MRPFTFFTTAFARLRGSRGMATIELAVGLVTVALMLAAVSGVVGVLILQDSCRDVAGEIARERARGDEAGERQARAQAPRGARITVTTAHGWVTVRVEAERRWGTIGPVSVKGVATVPLEVGVDSTGEAPSP